MVPGLKVPDAGIATELSATHPNASARMRAIRSLVARGWSRCAPPNFPMPLYPPTPPVPRLSLSCGGKHTSVQTRVSGDQVRTAEHPRNGLPCLHRRRRPPPCRL